MTAQKNIIARLRDAGDNVDLAIPPSSDEHFEGVLIELALRLNNELTSLKAAYARAESTITQLSDSTCRPAEEPVERPTNKSTFPPRSTTLTTEVATVTFARDGATLTITVTALPSILKNAVAGVIDAVEVIP